MLPLSRQHSLSQEVCENVLEHSTGGVMWGAFPGILP